MYRKFSMCFFILSLYVWSTIGYTSFTAVDDDFINNHKKRKITNLQLEQNVDKSTKHTKIDTIQAAIADYLLSYIFAELPLYDIIRCSRVSIAWHNAYRLLLHSNHIPAFCKYSFSKRCENYRVFQIDDKEFIINYMLIGIRKNYNYGNAMIGCNIHNISDGSCNMQNLDELCLKIEDKKAKLKKEYKLYQYLSILQNLSETFYSSKPFLIEDTLQDYALIRQWYDRSLINSAAIANINIAYMYRHGKGVKQSYHRAENYFMEACEWYEIYNIQHLASVQYLVGIMEEKWCNKYLDEDGEYGIEVADNYCNAETYLEKAAIQGYIDAQYRLGLLYDSDYDLARYKMSDYKGMTSVNELRLYWYQQAADQGHVKAQYALAHMYNSGRGVPKNEVEAIAWYRKAAEQEHKQAQYNLKVK